MSNQLRKLCIGTLASLFIGNVFAEQSNNRVFDIARTTGEVKVDGKLDEPAWQQASKMTLDYTSWPEENAPAPEKTEVFYMEDGKTLYVAFKAYDSNPDKIRAFYNRRDFSWQDDLVGIKLDPYNNRRLAFQFFINPLGIQMDSTENVITGRESLSWDAIWESKGELTDYGYLVEIAIPLSTFNFNDQLDKQSWAFEFVRFIPRDTRVRISNMKIDHDNSCWVCQMETLRGFEGAEQGKNLTLVPTMVSAMSESRNPSSNDMDWTSEDDTQVGLDVKWGITPDIFLNATLNPDFSQVEADDPQLSINNNFTLFVQEKRPFFLENHEYFSTQHNLLYTRNIGNPDYGTKVTGRINNHAFGAMVANDENTVFLVPGNLGSSVAFIDEESKNAAVRYRYDANEQLSMGYIGTFRSSDSYENNVSSMDMRYQINDQSNLRAQYSHSSTEYPESLYEDFCWGDDCSENADLNCSFGDCVANEQVLRTRKQDKFSGSALSVNYSYEGRHLSVWAGYNDIDPDFRGDLGFMSTVDFSKFVIGAGYTWIGDEDDTWVRQGINGDWDITHNDAGEVLEKEVQLFYNISGPMQSMFNTGCIYREKVGNRWNSSTLSINNNTNMFKENSCEVYVEASPLSGLFMGLYSEMANEIDYDNNRLGEATIFGPAINYSFNKHLRLEFRHTYKKMEVDNNHLFTANLSNFKLNYLFDDRHSLRLTVIQRDIERSPENYLYYDPSSRYKNRGTQFVYSYKLNPLTALFVGYTDNAYMNDDIRSLTKDQRLAFIKLTYAWHK